MEMLKLLRSCSPRPHPSRRLMTTVSRRFRCLPGRLCASVPRLTRFIDQTYSSANLLNRTHLGIHDDGRRIFSPHRRKWLYSGSCFHLLTYPHLQSSELSTIPPQVTRTEATNTEDSKECPSGSKASTSVSACLFLPRHLFI